MSTRRGSLKPVVPTPRTDSADGPTYGSARQVDVTAMPNLAGLRVLVIGINYSPEPTGIAPYTTGIAEQLARHAEHVTVLTGLPHYPSWQVPGSTATTRSSSCPSPAAPRSPAFATSSRGSSQRSSASPTRSPSACTSCGQQAANPAPTSSSAPPPASAAPPPQPASPATTTCP